MYTWNAQINGRDFDGGQYKTLDEAEDRFCTFMCNNYDHYSQTRNVKPEGIFGSIMSNNGCVGGYDVWEVED